MTYGSAREAPQLTGGDPAPGDAGEISTVIGQLREAADAARTAKDMLNAMGTDRGGWTGPAAAAFAGRRGELVTDLVTVEGAYEDAIDALDSWWRRLQPLQDQAVRIAAQARRLAPVHTTTATTAFLVPTGPTPQQQALHALQVQHDAIAHEATALAKQCATALAAAATRFPNPRQSWWQRAGSNVADYLEYHVKDELDHWNEILGRVALVLDCVTLVVTAIPFLAPLDVVLVPLTAAANGLYLATSVLKLTVDVVLVANHREKGEVIREDGLNLALSLGGGLGKIASKGARAGVQLGRGAAAADEMSVRVGDLAAKAYSGSLRQEALIDRSVTAFHDSGRFAERSEELLTSTGVRSVLKDFRHDLNPLREAHEDRKLVDLVRDSKHYSDLPRLDRWLPEGHELQVAVGSGLDLADKRHEIKEWLKGSSGDE